METIHILQKTYELLYVARIPLLNYLSDRLPAISSKMRYLVNTKIFPDSAVTVIRILNLDFLDFHKQIEIFFIMP